jgi:hypothetical protein
MTIKRNNKNSIWTIMKQLTILCGIVLMAFSCEKDLEEEVFSSFTANNFYTSVQAAELGMWGIYDALASEELYGRGYLLYFDTGTDQERFFRQGRGNDDDLLANYQIEETNSWIGSAWSQFYTGI